MDGTYSFSDVPPGNYHVTINLPIFACVVPSAPFSWVGDDFFGYFCPARPSTQFTEVTLAAGEQRQDVDFPQIPMSYGVTGRIWANAAPVSANASVAVTVAGHECWPAAVERHQTAAGIAVSFYAASLNPSGDPACAGGDLEIAIDGQPVGLRTPWNSFWRSSVFQAAPAPLNLASDQPPFVASTDLELPAFLAVQGQVVEPGTVTPQTVGSDARTLVSDGTEVRALIDSTECGRVTTRALTGPAGRFGGNLFGLVVSPASVKAGCGTSGAAVTFCVGNYVALQPASGPFSLPGAGTPVVWEASALSDITLEAASEPCPDLPVALPVTGGTANPVGLSQ
jgi:hypothetical protein